MHSIAIYIAYFKQFLKSRLAYRGDFIASMFSNILVTIFGLLFIVVLIDGKTVMSLEGWTRNEVLFIYGYSMIAMAIFSTFSPNLYQFGDRYIIHGEFDRVLLRPVNSLFQVLFESFNLESFGSLLVGLLVTFSTAAKMELSLGPLDYIWLVLSAVSGGIILLAVFVALASVSFHFEDRIGIAPPVYNLITFGRYPLPVFHEAIQFVLRWIIPFGFVAFYPATHFLNKSGFELFCYSTPLMALVCVAVATAAWRFGVSRYSSTGS